MYINCRPIHMGIFFSRFLTTLLCNSLIIFLLQYYCAKGIHCKKLHECSTKEAGTQEEMQEGNITGVILKEVKSCDSKRKGHSGQWMQRRSL